MKNIAAILFILIATAWAASATRVSAQSAAQTQFRVEIQLTAQPWPKAIVTNISGKTLTACHIEKSLISDPKQPFPSFDWDSVIQGAPPLEPNNAITLNLRFPQTDPVPDQVEVVAAIFADGSTFGPDDFINRMLAARAQREMEYDQTVTFIQ
ncbi:MAG TPA: hypothetical protein VGD60_10705 [Candidatus Acidoferrales bacterium]